jgi:hypothetical protein
MTFLSLPTSTSAGRPESHVLEEVDRRVRVTTPTRRLERERWKIAREDELGRDWIELDSKMSGTPERRLSQRFWKLIRR